VPPFSSAQSPSCDDQGLRQELAERERVIRELESKHQRFQALEQNVNQLSKQHQQLIEEMRSPGSLPGCPPAGKTESTNPRIPAPALTTPPYAPLAEEKKENRLFKLFD